MGVGGGEKMLRDPTILKGEKNDKKITITLYKDYGEGRGREWLTRMYNPQVTNEGDIIGGEIIQNLS